MKLVEGKTLQKLAGQALETASPACASASLPSPTAVFARAKAGQNALLGLCAGNHCSDFAPTAGSGGALPEITDDGTVGPGTAGVQDARPLAATQVSYNTV